jgi:hypothetical protein
MNSKSGPRKSATLSRFSLQSIHQNIGHPLWKLKPYSCSTTFVFGYFQVLFKKLEFSIFEYGQMKLKEGAGRRAAALWRACARICPHAHVVPTGKSSVRTLGARRYGLVRAPWTLRTTHGTVRRAQGRDRRLAAGPCHEPSRARAARPAFMRPRRVGCPWWRR